MPFLYVQRSCRPYSVQDEYGCLLRYALVNLPSAVISLPSQDGLGNMDYYSESYQDFERDFYRYSNMNIPLTFLTDDILKTMATSRKNYFVLNKEKSRDNRDHFFIFEVSTVDENPLIYHYTYKKTTIYLAEK